MGGSASSPQSRPKPSSRLSRKASPSKGHSNDSDSDDDDDDEDESSNGGDGRKDNTQDNGSDGVADSDVDSEADGDDVKRQQQRLQQLACLEVGDRVRVRLRGFASREGWITRLANAPAAAAQATPLPLAVDAAAPASLPSPSSKQRPVGGTALADSQPTSAGATAAAAAAAAAEPTAAVQFADGGYDGDVPLRRMALLRRREWAVQSPVLKPLPRPSVAVSVAVNDGSRSADASSADAAAAAAAVRAFRPGDRVCVHRSDGSAYVGLVTLAVTPQQHLLFLAQRPAVAVATAAAAAAAGIEGDAPSTAGWMPRQSARGGVAKAAEGDRKAAIAAALRGYDRTQHSCAMATPKKVAAPAIGDAAAATTASAAVLWYNVQLEIGGLARQVMAAEMTMADGEPSP